MLTAKQAVELMLSEEEKNDPDSNSQARKRAHKRLLAALRINKIEGAVSQGGRLWLIPEDSFKKYLENPVPRGWKPGRKRKADTPSPTEQKNSPVNREGTKEDILAKLRRQREIERAYLEEAGYDEDDLM